MSLLAAILEHAHNHHPCLLCKHTDGDWCKWSDTAAGGVPFHVMWHSIDWTEPGNYANCTTNTFTSADLEG